MEECYVDIGACNFVNCAAGGKQRVGYSIQGGLRHEQFVER